jgi:hypothetical protein
MNENMTATGEIIKFENGVKVLIYKRLTKKGIRYYYRNGFRYIPISESRISQLIYGFYNQ